MTISISEHFTWWLNRTLRPAIWKVRTRLALLLDPGTVGYMCTVDAECELGGASGGNTVYPSVKDLERCAPGCYKSCGVTRVHVILGDIIIKRDYMDCRYDRSADPEGQAGA